MTELIDDVSDHVLSVRGNYLLTRMKYINPCTYYMHHVTLFFFLFSFFLGLLAQCLLFRDLFAASFIL